MNLELLHYVMLYRALSQHETWFPSTWLFLYLEWVIVFGVEASGHKWTLIHTISE